MIRRFFDWLSERKTWKSDHMRTWKGFTEADSEGITKFQTKAISDIESQGVQLQFQRMGQSEAYFVATIQGTEIEVFIYSNGAQVMGNQNLLRAEEWDYRTPEDLIQALVSVVCKNAPAT